MSASAQGFIVAAFAEGGEREDSVDRLEAMSNW
jgi:hypothetical protein